MEGDDLPPVAHSRVCLGGGQAINVPLMTMSLWLGGQPTRRHGTNLGIGFGKASCLEKGE